MTYYFLSHVSSSCADLMSTASSGKSIYVRHFPLRLNWILSIEDLGSGPTEESILNCHSDSLAKHGVCPH